LRLAGHRFRLRLCQPRHQIRARRHYRTCYGLSGERTRRLGLLRLLRRLRPWLTRLLSSSGRWLLLRLLHRRTRRLRPCNRLPGLNRPRRAWNNDRRRRNGSAGQRLPRTSQNLTWTRRSGSRLLWHWGHNRLGSRSLRLRRSSPLLWLLCLNGRRRLLRLGRRLRARNRRLNSCRRAASRSGCNLCSGRTDRGWRRRRLARTRRGNRWLKRSVTAEQRRTQGYGRPRRRNRFDDRGRGLFGSPLLLFLRCGRRFLLRSLSLRSRFRLGSRFDLFLLFFFLLCLLFGRRRHSLFLRGFGVGRLAAVTIDAEVLLDVLSNVLVNRAGVSLLLGHTELRQQFEYLVGFNFQLPRQLVDSNLLHIENCQASRTDSGRASSRTTFHTYPARRLSLVLTGLRRANPSPLS